MLQGGSYIGIGLFYWRKAKLNAGVNEEIRRSMKDRLFYGFEANQHRYD